MKESIRLVYKRLYPYKYKLVEPLVIQTDIYPESDIIHEYFAIYKDGLMTINAGYSFDGASGPAIDTENFLRGACAHDVPFQAAQLCYPLPKDWREKANKMLVRLTREDGMSWIRCKWVYAAVSMFGRGLPRDLNKYDEILIAP